MMNERNGIRVDRELVLKFFLTFARAEYALKNSGYVKGNENRAFPDWDAFAASIRDSFDKTSSEALEQSTTYILDNPPMRQVLCDGKLVWEANRPESDKSEVEVLLLLIRRIRNNLFHGGKHNIEESDDPERITSLLRGALVVLEASLGLQPHVKRTYDRAVI